MLTRATPPEIRACGGVYSRARLEAFCGPADEAPYAARLSYLMAMIDDFG